MSLIKMQRLTCAKSSRRSFCVCNLQGGAEVHEADQSARLQRQERVRCAAAGHRPADGPAPSSGNSASHALFTESLSGPGMFLTLPHTGGSHGAFLVKNLKILYNLLFRIELITLRKLFGSWDILLTDTPVMAVSRNYYT